MIRLLLVTESFHPVYSGAAIRFRRYLPGLRARGVEVRVLTGTPKASKAGMSAVPAEWAEAPVGGLLPIEHVDGFEVVRVRLPDESDRARAEWLATAVLAEAESPRPPDIVQTSTLGEGWVATLQSLRSLGIPSVNVRTMVAGHSRNPFRRWRQIRRQKRVLREVDRIVVGSSAMRDDLGAWRIDNAVIIAHGVDLRRFHPMRDPDERRRIRREWGIEDQAFACVYAGPISPRKGVDSLVSAWRQVHAEVPAAHLILVGPRRDASDPDLAWFASRLSRLTGEAGGRSVVRSIGMVDDIECHLRAADMFAFPSLREGMPNIFAEAMATGLPIVSVPFRGLPVEFGRPGVEFLLSSRGSESLSKSILGLIRDPDHRARLGGAALNWAQTHLDVEKSLDAYCLVYESLLEKR